MNTKPNRIAFTTQRFDAVATLLHIYSREMTLFAKKVEIFLRNAELQKSHGYAGITREKGLQTGQSVRKVSCQHTTYCILNTNIKKLIDDDLFQKIIFSS